MQQYAAAIGPVATQRLATRGYCVIAELQGQGPPGPNCTLYKALPAH